MTAVGSFDFRKELSDSDQAVGSGLALSERAIFLTRMDVPSLRLGSTVPMDQGLYRCRVDFGRSPTRNHRVNLTITSELALPQPMCLQWDPVIKNL